MVAAVSPPAARLYDANLEISDSVEREPLGSTEDEDGEAGRLKSLTFAFVAGGATVGLCLAALRLGQSRAKRRPYMSVSSDADLE